MVLGAMDGSRHILVVDDDKEIRALLSHFLARSGYRVSVAQNGAAMMQTLAAARIDLVILDIMMPGEDGLSLCRRLRVNRNHADHHAHGHGRRNRPCGRTRDGRRRLPPETVQHAGAARPDPCGVAPIGHARSRFRSGTGRVFEFAGWRLDVTRRQLHSPAKALVDLRAAEFDLLLALVERPNHVLTRDQLLDLARGRAATAFDRSIDVHVSRLRHRIEVDPKEPELIKTVRSGGYVFAAPVTLNGAAW